MFDDSHRQRLAALLAKGPQAHGYDNALWSLPRVRAVVAEHLGIRASTTDIWRLLRSMRWSPQKPARRARERKENKIREWKEKKWPEISARAARGASVARLPDPAPKYHKFRRVRHLLDRLRGAGIQLSDQVKAFCPDHIFVNQGGTWDAAFTDLGDFLNSFSGLYSLICHLNAPAAAFSQAQLAAADQLVDGACAIFFPSRLNSDLAEVQLGRKIPCRRSFQYPHRFGFAEPLPWPEVKVPRLAIVSRLDVLHKGLDVALQALASLAADRRDFQFTLYGDGPDKPWLERSMRSLGLVERCSFGGYTSAIDEVWRNEEILLLPSRWEGCAVALTEAMGFGRPVIATAVGGAPEWIEDGANGLICPAPDRDLLVATLKRALAERPRWREMGLAAHRKIKERLDPRPARVFLEALK